MALNIKADKISQIIAESAADEKRSFDPIPDGSYCASVFSAEDCTREAKSGNTLDYVKCHFKIEGGQYDNRREFDDLVYSNSGSAQHGEIGVKRLTQLWSSLGGSGDLNVPNLNACDGKFELVIKTVPSKDPQYGPKRQFYFNKCSESCVSPSSDSVSVSDHPADDGGDIWS